MHGGTVLGDVISSLFDRRKRNGNDKRDIAELCEALLSAEGEISGRKLAALILSRYRALDAAGKREFFTLLSNDFDIDPAVVADSAKAYGRENTAENLAALEQAAEPRRQELIRRLNQQSAATAELVAMRVDLLDMLSERPELKRIDLDFTHLFRSWFLRGFLMLKPMTWNSPAAVLEKIVAYEAVHAIQDWDELRRRLYPADRRCFAFFHPAMPDEPLIFVEVALTSAIPGSIQTVLAEDRDAMEAEEATTAVFYSISNCQRGLKGISFGNFLIKQVARELLQELPQLETFVTLSPIPGFNTWLKEQESQPYAEQILAGQAEADDVRQLAAHYLLEAKNQKGMPRDPVARFHLSNGATAFDVHADADLSASGRSLSSGAMVNYFYDLKATERNHELLIAEGRVAASKTMRTLSKAGAASLV